MGTKWQIGDVIPDPDTQQKRWEVFNILGGYKRSGMGIVYVIYDHKWREPFAFKTFQDEVFNRNPTIAARFTQEALTWINLDAHQNVTRARFVQKIEGKPYLLLEYVSGGDLSGWIGTPRLTHDLPQVLRFAIQLCDGMSHALSKGIQAHRDLKPQNCLITQDHTLKITDFGLAKVFDDDATPSEAGTPEAQINLTHTGAAGTCTHMAPEQFKDAKRVDVRADIYSFGVMLYEMIVGKLPFDGQSWRELELQHLTQPPPELVAPNPELREVVARCLAKKPEERDKDFSGIRERLSKIYERLTGDSPPQPLVGAELNAEELSNKATSLGELGHLNEALTCCKEALKINPRSASAWLNKGTVFKKLGKSEEALACQERSIELNPRSAVAWYNQGWALLELNRMEETIAAYDRAIELDPHLNEKDALWFNKGVAWESLGQMEQAITCFNRAIALNERMEPAWYNKGVVFRELGKVEEEITCYRRALEINPRFKVAWNGLSHALKGLGQKEEAYICSQRMVELDSADAEAWFSQGAMLFDLGKLQEAFDCLQHALDINPRNEKVWAFMGVILYQAGRPEEAVVYYDNALKIYPRYNIALYNKGIALVETGQMAEAVTCFNYFLESYQADGWALYYKGVALMELQCCDEALICFKKAEEAGHPQAAEAVAVCLQMLGR